MIRINTKKKMSHAFNVIFYSFSDLFKIIDIDPGLQKMFLRIFRTAILADILYQASSKRKNSDGEEEIFSLLFESFIFQMRIIYDLSTNIIQKTLNQKIKKSFNKFLSDFLRNKIGDIDEELKTYLGRYNKKFIDLKTMRDALKMDTIADVYLKNKKYYVYVKYFDKSIKSHKVLNDKLSIVIFNQCAFLCLLAVYLKKVVQKNNDLRERRLKNF